MAADDVPLPALIGDIGGTNARFALIDRNARKGKLPSDHAPMLIDIAD